MYTLDPSKPIIMHKNEILKPIKNERKQIYECVVQMEQTPNKFKGIIVKDRDTDELYVENLDTKRELKANEYSVDYREGRLYFHESKDKKWVKFDYYGEGYTLISDERIYTRLGKDGNLEQTMADILVTGKEGVAYMEQLQVSISNGTDINNQLKSSIVTGNKSKTDLDASIANSVAKDTSLKATIADSVVKDGLLKATIADSVVKDGTLKTTIVNANDKKIELEKEIATADSKFVTKEELNNATLTELTTNTKITSLDSSQDGIIDLKSIKGKTLQNIIKNGDFNKGISNWSADYGSILSSDNNVGRVTGDGTKNYLSIAQFLNPSFFVPTNKIYSKMIVRTTDAGLDVKPEILLQLRDTSILTVDKISNASQNIWYSLSGISSIVGQEAPYLRALIFYTTNEQQKNRVLEIKEVLTIDLTQMFGVGHEPTKEWCDQNLAYFDGIKSVAEEFSPINLFDKSKVTLNTVIRSDGATQGGSTDWYVTDFISVAEGKELLFNKVTTSDSGGLGFYKNKVFVSWISNRTLNNSGGKIRVPIGVDSIRATNHNPSISVDSFIINQEEYKIKIISTGKNLFDKNNVINKKSLEASTGKISDHPLGWVSDYINVNQNTDYMIAKGMGSGTYGYCFYNSDKVFISGVLASTGQNTPQKITTPINTSYIKLGGLISLIDSQQLEKGTVATEYESYKSDKSEIQLGTPLKGLPNGISDELIGGKINRRVDKIVLNGSENWSLTTSYVKVSAFKLTGVPNAPITNQTLCSISNNIGSQINANWNIDNEGILFLNNGDLLVKILKSKLATQDLAGFKKWLSENNTEVHYELATPTISDLNISTLKSFKDGNLQLNNLITPTVNLKYATNITGRLSTLETALDKNVDDVRKLEEGLFTTVGQVIDNTNKITKIKDVTEVSLAYVPTFVGGSKVYKNNQVVNIPEFAITLPSISTTSRVHVATLAEGYRPVGETRNLIADGQGGEFYGIVEVFKDGKIYIRKIGTGYTSYRGNITFITKE